MGHLGLYKGFLMRYEGVQKENEDSGRRNFQFQEKFT